MQKSMTMKHDPLADMQTEDGRTPKDSTRYSHLKPTDTKFDEHWNNTIIEEGNETT